MPERGVYRASSIRGYATLTNAPIRVDTTSNALLIAPAGSGTVENTIPQLPSGSASGATKITAGFANFVSGAATVATGLTTVISFQYNLVSTGFATGATEITDAVISGAFTGAISTGSVTLQGFRLQTTTASASGTGLFNWIAIGT